MAQKVRWKHGSHSVHDFCCNLKRWIVGSSLFLVHVSSRFNMASCTNPQVNYSVPKSWTITYFVPDFTPKKIWCTYPCAGGMPKRARQLSPGLVLDREAGEIDHLGWTDCFSVRGCWEILRNLPLCAWLFIYRILYKVNHTWDACTWIQAMIPVPAVKQSKTKCCRKTKIQKNEYENQCMKRCSNPIFCGAHSLAQASLDLLQPQFAQLRGVNRSISHAGPLVGRHAGKAGCPTRDSWCAKGSLDQTSWTWLSRMLS